VPLSAVALLASAASPLLETLGIWTFKRVVDEVLVPHSLRALGPLAAWLAAIAIGDAAAGAADRVLSAWAAEGFLASLRTRLFAQLVHLPPRTLDRRPLGDLLVRLDADADQIAGFVLAGLGGAVADVLRVLFFVAALLRLDVRLTVAALAAVPAFALALRRFSAPIREAARRERRHQGSAIALAQETLSAATLVQAFGREEHVCTRFAAEARAVMRAHLAGTRQRAVLAPLLDLVDLAGGLAVVALGTWAIANGRLTLGGVLAFLTFLAKLYRPVRALGGVAGRAWTAAAAAERILDVLAEPRAVGAAASAGGAGGLRRVRGAVTFERVSFRYPDAPAAALHDVSFRLEPGCALGIVGRSGAGKSTLVRLLLRLEEPSEGRILLDGVDVRELPVDLVRAAIGYVPQEPTLFHASVHENIAFGRLDAGRDEIREAARRAGAAEFVEGLPRGYETVVGERGARLSGGQRQRIAVARALVRDPAILLLDEPLVGLDAVSARLVLASARPEPGRAVVLVTHDLGAVRDADEIVVLDQGRVVARGGYEELGARRGLLRHIARRPVAEAGDR
jgi:ABC-type multidrug transport system fused ATPase/permease subunit